jgi:hypothetical protein
LRKENQGMKSESRETLKGLLQQFRVISSHHEILTSLNQILDDKSGGYFLALNPEKILSAYHDDGIKKNPVGFKVPVH